MIDKFLTQDNENEGVYSTFIIFSLTLSALFLSNSIHEILFLAIFLYAASLYRVFRQSFYNVSENRFAGLTNLGILYGALVLFFILSFVYSLLFVLFGVIFLNLVIKKYNILFHHPRLNSL